MPGESIDPLFDSDCDCPRGPSSHPHAVHATTCASRRRTDPLIESQNLTVIRRALAYVANARLIDVCVDLGCSTTDGARFITRCGELHDAMKDASDG